MCSQCIVVVAPYPSSLGGVYQPVTKHRHTLSWICNGVSRALNLQKYVLTILFMNLHKGLV